jgi:5-methylcytosine-specific restriction endonuclease McrA
MGKRQKAWARTVRDWLFEKMGRKCVECGSDEELEFDVIVPVGDPKEHHKKEWSSRMSFYKREYLKGNLQVLCSQCNSRKNDKVEDPF